ncbi:efflux RND transporter permease subunit [Galbibacter sp. EGI 63066]|uniref:efflux RND transporter permease subunit n=1 Tax=Galbibacter sp. EGI 63066 TaxID=2993559 RepID=UPI002248900E|nr:efflux RND transporter permease subunit [Galbibacter sp. EGI 63066]MCX2679993.1 efflux RND transporter permease subunit [Galbibacter sp. EGI 63066]
MRKILSYFIKYDVAVNVIIIAFAIFGIFGALNLKSSFFPLVESRTININVAYPGAAPQEIEEGIIIKIEDNLKGIEGIDRVTSTSRENGGSITVEILMGYDIDFMLLEVKNAVDRVPTFPSGMEPLVVGKQEAIRETISFSVNGKGVALATLKKIARDVENDMRRFDGISQIEITGYPAEEIEIAVRELDLLAYNLTFAEVASAVSQSNLLVTGGNIKTDSEDYLIRANNRSYYGDELNNIVVKALPNGTSVRLRDVAEIRDRFEENPNASYFNGNLGVNITISNTNSEDLISTAEVVNDYIDEFNSKYNNVKLDVVNDSSIRLKQRTNLLAKNAWQGILLVLIFLSLFLNSRLAFWVAFGLPISFLGLFIFGGMFGVTINVLSLFGMIIVIGILVDDGIVIAENIYQHYERGATPIKAAINGTLEVIPPIVSAIITTILAFSTFLFLDSRIGEFFSEVATVVIITLSVSLVEALIILPAHIAHSKALVKETKEEKANRSTMQRFFAKMREVNKYGDIVMDYLRDKVYSPALKFCLRYQLLSFGIAAMLFIITIGAIGGGIIRTTLFPNVASDRVSVELLMPEGTNPKVTDSIITMVEENAWKVNEKYTAKQTGNKPVIQNIIKRVGPGTNKASLNINMLPGEERDFASSLITNNLRDTVGEVYGVERLTFGSGGNFGGKPVSVSLLGNNREELKQAKEFLKERLKANPLLKDVIDSDPQGIKEILIELKESAYSLGLDLRTVMDQVRSGFFGRQAQRFQRGQDEIRVWVRYDRSDRGSINDLDEMRIVTPTGDRVPLSEIATYRIERGDESIAHLEGVREIRVEADLSDPQASATDILLDIQNNIMPELQSHYSTVTASYEGQNREAQRLSDSATKVFPIIIFLIYAVIAFTFRSYGQPFLLLLMIPFSLIGVAWGHYLLGFPINVLSMLGIIALIGIMVNDGLVLIGKFNGYLTEGKSYAESILLAGKSRFRAIFLTSLTTIAGLAPLLLEKSRQAQFLKPMAISISFGIGIATFLTLLMLPTLLSMSNRIKVTVKWLKTGQMVKPREVERAVKELKAEKHEL